jgi:hypothetical protein
MVSAASVPIHVVCTIIGECATGRLVGQTLAADAQLLGGVPTRPSQNAPERVVQWERRRRVVGQKIRALRLERGSER